MLIMQEMLMGISLFGTMGLLNSKDHGPKLDQQQEPNWMSIQMLLFARMRVKVIGKDIPIEETILNCKDITRFVCVRNVKGGAHKDSYYLGKVIRWAYFKNEIGTINYILTGNKVPTQKVLDHAWNYQMNFLLI